MQQTIKITGMTCEACEYKIQHVFGQIDGINHIKADFATGNVTFEAKANIPLQALEKALKPHAKYGIGETLKNQKSTLQSLYPLFLVFAFIIVVAYAAAKNNFTLKSFLHHFMTGFFLVFSFFKLLDIKAFANSFAMYDIIGKKSMWYAKLYPFIELVLGIACLFAIQLKWVYAFDIIIMTIGLIGVLQSVLNKKQIQCACLGTVFNLPMTSVTIIENTIMILVGGYLISA